MFNRYYESELSYLRDLGREFAAANPELAGVFAQRGGDPDVERLLEGFAFLTARIRERIDDAIPELIDSLSQLLLPHYTRATPAGSIVQLTPHPHAIRGRHRVERGTELAARATHGTKCLFRTTTDIDLLPLTLERSRLDENIEASPAITLSFRVDEGGRRAVFDAAGVRLFVQGPLAQASQVFLWLCRHLTAVTYRGRNGQEHELPTSCLRAIGLDDEHGLLPWPERAPRGPRLLQEYFALPQKLLFFDVTGLDRIPETLQDDRFELRLRFHRPPRLAERFDDRTFQLYCAPVVNLFDVPADPAQRDARAHEYLLRAAGIDPRHADVHAVRSVVGLRDNRRSRRIYQPFFDYAHTAQAGSEQAYYTLRRARSPIDGGIDTYLAIKTPRDVAPAEGQETLSIDLSCTNRFLPNELRAGDICVPTASSPTVARFTNITGVSAPALPPFGTELHWRLLSHVALNQRSLGEPEVLRSLLSLYDFLPETHPQGRANRLRAASVRKVALRMARHVVHGAPIRGTAASVEIDEASFPSLGDAFLFGCALDAWLGEQTPINSFTQLTLTLHPTSSELTWTPRNGTQALI